MRPRPHLAVWTPVMLARAPLPLPLTEAARQKTTVVEQPAPPSTTQGLAPALDASGFAAAAGRTTCIRAQAEQDARRQAALRVWAGDDLPGPQRDVREAGRRVRARGARGFARPGRLMMFCNSVFQLDV